MLLHVLAVGSIVAATLYLLARAVLAHVGAAGYFTAYNFGWCGARSDRTAPFLWIGPMTVSRHHFGFEWVCDRFSGELGRARTVGAAFAGVSVTFDMHDRTARLLTLAPWLYPVYAVIRAGFEIESGGDPLPWAAVTFLLVPLVLIMSLLWSNDVLRTDLHYATVAARDSGGDEHEAYERGRHEGQRFEQQRQRFAAGERHDAPPYPANPYAA